MAERAIKNVLIAFHHLLDVENVMTSLSPFPQFQNVTYLECRDIDETLRLLRNNSFQAIVVDASFPLARKELLLAMRHTDAAIVLVNCEETTEFFSLSSEFTTISSHDLPHPLLAHTLLEKFAHARTRSQFATSTSPFFLLQTSARTSFEPRKLIEESIDAMLASHNRAPLAITCFVHPEVPVLVEGREELFRAYFLNSLALVVNESQNSCVSIDINCNPSTDRVRLEMRLSSQTDTLSAQGESTKLCNEFCRLAARQLGGSFSVELRVNGELQLEASANFQSSRKLVELAPRTDFSQFQILLLGTHPTRLKEIRSILRHRGANVHTVRAETFLRNEHEQLLSDMDVLIVDTVGMSLTQMSTLFDELKSRADDDTKLPVLVTGPISDECLHDLVFPVEVIDGPLKQSLLYRAVAKLVSDRYMQVENLDSPGDAVSLSPAVPTEDTVSIVTPSPSFLDSIQDVMRTEALTQIEIMEIALREGECDTAYERAFASLRETAFEFTDETLELLCNEYSSIEPLGSTQKRRLLTLLEKMKALLEGLDADLAQIS